MDNNLPILRYKDEIERVYSLTLAPYATKFPCENSRVHAEKVRETENRSDFQRDRDRIIHSDAFRRMMYKTQVFVNHKGDYFRTRLTHSLEVAQFARGISKSLALNEDLAEAIALGHDLGHTPFGHAAEDVLSEKLKIVGLSKFYHNEQSVRVVELIESRNPIQYLGLNLTREVREGILKHNNDRTGDFDKLNPLEPCSSLEGQIVKIVDTVAYTCHDLDDGIKSGILEQNCEQNEDIKEQYNTIQKLLNDKTGIKISYDNYKKSTFISELIHWFIEKLTNNVFENLEKYKVKDLDDVKRLATCDSIALAAFDDSTTTVFKALKNFVTKCIYCTSTVQIMDSKAIKVIEDIYDAYYENPKMLPAKEKYKVDNYKKHEVYKVFEKEVAKARIICDYIACMTDRFALDEHEKLFNARAKI